MRPIETDADVASGLAALLAADPRLAPLAAATGPLPLRRRAGGFEGLASIISAQQISDAAAAAIWARVKAAVDPFTAAGFAALDDATLRAAGLSRAKVATLRGLAAAVSDGLDLDALARRPADDAVAALVALRGVGPWTAEVYLLFCVGHPDVFPAGDLALQVGACKGLALAGRPTEKTLRAMAQDWAPWRGVAARLLWAYYRAQRKSDVKGLA